MSAIQTLRALIRSMPDSEINICLNYTRAFDNRGEKHEKKMHRLIHLLRSPDKIKDSELEFLLYGRRNTVAFSKLLYRLRDKLLQSLIQPFNSYYYQTLSEAEKQQIALQWKLLQCRMLLKREQYDLAGVIIHSSIEIATRYELFREHIAFLRLQMMIGQTGQNGDETGKLERALLRVSKQRTLYLACRQLIRLMEHPSASGISEKLRELTALSKQYGSSRSQYLLLECKARQHEMRNEFRKALITRKRQLVLVSQTPALQHERIKVDAFTQMARLRLKQRNFPEALASADLGAFHAEKSSRLLQEAWILKAVCAILSEKVALAHTVIQQAMQTGSSSRLLYLGAVTDFLMKEYENAIDVFEQIDFNELDRHGWGASARVLRQILIIEAGQEKSHRDTLRKLKRSERNIPLAVNLTEREHLVFDLMAALMESDLNFKRVFQENQTVIEDLRREHGSTAWAAERGELVIFPEWFMAKVLGGGYRK